MLFKKVLVPLDGSSLAEAALPYVKAIMPKEGGKVILLTVAGLAATGMQPDLPLRRYLQTIAKELKTAGVDATTAIARGTPADQIIYYADKKGVDLIVHSTHGYSGIKRWVMGSVAEKVVHYTCSAVLLVRSRAPRVSQVEFKKILVALDGSPFSEACMPYVEGLAQEKKAEVVVVRVVEEPVPPAPAVALGTRSIEYSEGLERAMREEAVSYGQKMKASLEAKRIKATVHVPSGSGGAAEKIMQVANDESVELIVMTTHGRSGVSRWLYGSVASRVMEESVQPVLLIRPCPPEGVAPGLLKRAARPQYEIAAADIVGI